MDVDVSMHFWKEWDLENKMQQTKCRNSIWFGFYDTSKIPITYGFQCGVRRYRHRHGPSDRLVPVCGQTNDRKKLDEILCTTSKQ